MWEACGISSLKPTSNQLRYITAGGPGFLCALGVKFGGEQSVGVPDGGGRGGFVLQGE